MPFSKHRANCKKVLATLKVAFRRSPIHYDLQSLVSAIDLSYDQSPENTPVSKKDEPADSSSLTTLGHDNTQPTQVISTPPNDDLAASVRQSSQAQIFSTGSTSTITPPKPQAASESEAPLDPLIAASAHDYRLSPLHRLPEEVLLLIMDAIRTSPDDNGMLTYFCLRRVCRVFRRLVHGDPLFHAHAEQQRRPLDTHLARCSLSRPDTRVPLPGGVFRELFGGLPAGSRGTLLGYLDRDQLCAGCFATWGREGGSTKQLVWGGCKLPSRRARRLICAAGCHDRGVGVRAFYGPVKHKSSPSAEATAVLVADGEYIRLCKHRVITWREVQALAEKFSASRSDDDGAGQSSESISPWAVNPSGSSDLILECQECRVEYSSVSKQEGLHSVSAKARLNGLSEPEVFQSMTLEFSAHKSMKLQNNQKINSSQMRDFFADIREISPSWTAPDKTPGSLSLPEMRSVDPTICDCVSYSHEMQGDVSCKPELGQRKHAANLFASHDVDFGRDSFLSVRPCSVHGTSRDGVLVRSSSVCIRATFYRHVWLYKGHNPGPLNPSHHWFDALDPASYTIQDYDGTAARERSGCQASSEFRLDTGVQTMVWPQCTNATCRNYCRMRRNSPCRHPSGFYCYG